MVALVWLDDLLIQRVVAFKCQVLSVGQAGQVRQGRQGMESRQARHSGQGRQGRRLGGSGVGHARRGRAPGGRLVKTRTQH